MCFVSVGLGLVCGQAGPAACCTIACVFLRLVLLLTGGIRRVPMMWFGRAGWSSNSAAPLLASTRQLQRVYVSHRQGLGLTNSWHFWHSPRGGSAQSKHTYAMTVFKQGRLVGKSRRELLQVCEHLIACRRCGVVTCGSTSDVARSGVMRLYRATSDVRPLCCTAGGPA